MASRAIVRLCVVLALTCTFAPVAVAEGQGPLADGFTNPPASAKPHTWWHWINGNTTKEGITADLEAMKRVGIGGAQIFNVDCGIPSGDAPFMGDKWRELIEHAVKEAHRLGIELCIHNCAGWSSSGGPWVTPDYAMKVLTWSERPVTGPASFSDTLALPQTRHAYYRDVAVFALRKPDAETPDNKLRITDLGRKIGNDRADQMPPDLSDTPAGMATPRDGVVDLSSKMAADGTLTWDVPAGDWTLIRMGYTLTDAVNAPAPESGVGLECDKLSREALDWHWAGMMDTVIKQVGPLAGKTLNNVLIDSYERGYQNWTPKFREDFVRLRGYDPTPYLPVITGRVIESKAVSERFLWDFRRTISDLWNQNYYGYMAELAHKHGMLASNEPYGNGIFDNLASGGAADIPMGEFWVGGGAEGTTKLAASASHTHGRKIAGAESFTADDRHAKWLYDPYAIKALGDAVFCMGVNRYIFHRYAMQPWLNLKPGMTMGPWGTNFDRTNTWWNQGAAWMKYVARCQYLLQSGKFVADFIYYMGDGGPSDLPGRGGLRPVPPDGYDYDGCDPSVLLTRMTVRNGRIVLPDGMSYRILVLPDTHLMTQRTMRKVRELVLAGAIVTGPKPTGSPSLQGYPQCDSEVRSLADQVWGACDGKAVTTHAYGKGRVFWGQPVTKVLARLGVAPDFSYKGNSGTRLMYIHRTIDGHEAYFISNQRYRTEEVSCTFRTRYPYVPQLWHPDTGVIESAPICTRGSGPTTVKLRLDPAGSVFVVFVGAALADRHLVSLNRTGPAAAQTASPNIVIRSARYEATTGSGGADVTAKVAELVRAGELSISASNEVFGDPTPLIVKQLRVEYTVNGKEMRQTVGENSTLDLVPNPTQVSGPTYDVELGDTVKLVPWQAGTYTARTWDDRTVKVVVKEPAKTLDIKGPWTVKFAPGWGAPASVQFNRLVSWSDRAEDDIRYFSGTAQYVIDFTVPASMIGADRAICLDLGAVKNLAEVQLNGKPLGILWKTPFRLDVTGIVRPGKNTLSVHVTNLWPNRLIGDAQLPDDVEWRGDTIAKWPDWLLQGKPRPQTGRYTFATWRFFTKDSPLLESGLIGPVKLYSAKKVKID